MGYAILRTQKLKSKISVRRSLKHAFREQETPNANHELINQNTHIGAKSSQEAFELFNQKLPEKVRTNAVYCIEYLITASPEDMKNKTREQQDAYFKDATQWLKKRHGENVFYIGIHRDETTPHMYAYAVPIDERKKLNCRSFLGGSKALSEMQTDFANEVGLKHNLSRGLEGSRARHQDIGQYYIRVNQKIPQIEDPEIPKPKLLESKESYGVRVANSFIEEINHHLIPLEMRSKELEASKTRAKEMERTARKAEDKVKAIQEVYEKREKVFQEELRKEKEINKKVAHFGSTLSNAILKGGEELEKVRESIIKNLEKNQEKKKPKRKDIEIEH